MIKRMVLCVMSCLVLVASAGAAQAADVEELERRLA